MNSNELSIVDKGEEYNRFSSFETIGFNCNIFNNWKLLAVSDGFMEDFVWLSLSQLWN